MTSQIDYFCNSYTAGTFALLWLLCACVCICRPVCWQMLNRASLKQHRIDWQAHSWMLGSNPKPSQQRPKGAWEKLYFFNSAQPLWGKQCMAHDWCSEDQQLAAKGGLKGYCFIYSAQPLSGKQCICWFKSKGAQGMPLNRLPTSSKTVQTSFEWRSRSMTQ